MPVTFSIPFSIPKLSVALVAGYAVWVFLAGTMKLPSWLFRQILYSQNFPVWLGQNLDKPESFGFLRNQITQLSIPVEDGSDVFAWLVTPLKLYAEHEAAFREDSVDESHGQALAVRMLAEDRQSRLIIYFHGNAGTVGQPKRTDAYRALSSIDSQHAFVLAFDYRGFGRTQGSPTEEGILADAVAVVNWALNTAQVPAHHIVIVSQSLGTAVASAVAHHFINQTPKHELAGLVLCAPFVDAPTAFQNYSIGGVVPLLAPLRVLPPLRNWFVRQFPDPWRTAERVRDLVRRSERLRLTFVHALNDMTIPPSQSDELFYAAVGAAEDGGRLGRTEIDRRKETIELGDGGWSDVWTSEDRVIRKDILRYGGHNTIMKWAPVSLAVARSFDPQE